MRVLTVDLTRNCENSCLHCRDGSIKNPGKSTIDFDELKELTDEAKELGLTDVFLSGGEPLLYPNFFRVLDMLLEKRVYVSVLTSAPEVGSDFFEKLSTYPNLVQLRVSIESTEPELLDFIRSSRNNFGRIIRFINNCLHYGLFFGVSSTITALNESEIPDLLDFAISHRANYFRISPYIKPEPHSSGSNEGCLEPYEISVSTAQIMEKAFRSLAVRLKNLRSSFIPLKGSPESFRSFFKTSCPALSHSAYVYKEKGEIFVSACPFLRRPSFNASRIGFKKAYSLLNDELKRIAAGLKAEGCLLDIEEYSLENLFEKALSIVSNSESERSDNMLLVFSAIISRQMEIHNMGYPPCWRSSPFFLYPLQLV
jgi:MoaA/NifB/PqqE/SkfB family radical SAM enzyme